MEIKDKIIIITGAANGIGLALAQRFHKEGAQKIICCDIDENGINKAAEKVDGIPMVCDVSRAPQVERVVRETENRFGRIDLYCANAGIMERGDIGISDTAWERSLSINFMAHVYAARTCLPGMIKRKSGYFLITASAAGLLTQLGAVAYSVSKHAAVSFAEWMAIHYGHQGIRVSLICPQAVNTSMIDDVEQGGVAGIDGVLSPEKIADDSVNAILGEQFLVLPHPKVEKYFQYKVHDYNGWIGSMQRLREKFPQG